MTTYHGSPFYPQTNLNKKYLLLSLAWWLSLYPWEFVWNKFNYAVMFLLLRYSERAVFLYRQPAPQLWHCLTISVQNHAVLFFWICSYCHRFKGHSLLFIICSAHLLPSSGLKVRVKYNTLPRCSLNSLQTRVSFPLFFFFFKSNYCLSDYGGDALFCFSDHSKLLSCCLVCLVTLTVLRLHLYPVVTWHLMNSWESKENWRKIWVPYNGKCKN